MIKVYKSIWKILIFIFVVDFIIFFLIVGIFFRMGGFLFDGKLVLVVIYVRGYFYWDVI